MKRIIAVGATYMVGVLAINGVNKIKYKHKIKKGLKDETVYEINGKYYEVSDDVRDRIKNAINASYTEVEAI